MKTEVRFLGIEASGALRDYALRRMTLHLGRFGRRIGSVVARIGDLNGPKGGADKRCHVAVRGRTLAPIIIDERTFDAYSAVDLAMERAARAVGREISRVRTGRRATRPPRRAS